MADLIIDLITGKEYLFTINSDYHNPSNPVTFNNEVSFNYPHTQYDSKIINFSSAITITSNSVRGNAAEGIWIGDGTNTPNLSAFDLTESKYSYSNTLNDHNYWLAANIGGEKPMLYIYKQENIIPQDTTPPTFTSGPTATTIQNSSFSINAQLNENGTIYMVLLISGDTAPTVNEILAGTGSGGATPVISNNLSDTGSGVVFNITGLSASTTYSAYLVASDVSGNTQTSYTSINVTTTDIVLTQLNAPTGLSVSAITQTELQLSWSDTNTSPNESFINIQESNDGITGWANIAQITADSVSYNRTGLTAGTTKYYRVNAAGDGVTTSDSVFSNVASGITQTGSGSITLAENVGLTAVSTPAPGWRGDNSAFNSFGLANEYANNAEDCEIECEIVSSIGENSVIIGLDSLNTNKAYNSGNGYDYGFFVNSTGDLFRVIDGVLTDTTQNVIVGSKVRLQIVSGNLKLQYASDGSAFSDVYDFGPVSGNLYVNINIQFSFHGFNIIQTGMSI